MKNYLNYIKENNSNYSCDIEYEDVYDADKYLDCVRNFIKENGINAITENKIPILFKMIYDYFDFKTEDDKILDDLLLIIKELINNKDIDLNVYYNTHKTNILMDTCMLVEENIVKELLATKKIDINELDYQNNNALMHLAPEEEIYELTPFINIMNMLIDSGININRRNINNYDFFSMLISTESFENDVDKLLPIFEILMKNGLVLDIDHFELIDCIDNNEKMIEIIKIDNNDLYKEYEFKKNTDKYKI